jgi:toxin ParE1/3/4
LVRILDEAAEEAAEAAAWYETERLGLGREFFEAADAAIDLIEEGLLPLLPMSGRAREKGAKRTILKRFPDDIVTVERPHETVVIAVADHARKPGYWRNRLKGS